MDTLAEKQKTSIITYIVFVIALVVVFINLTSLFFPSLFTTLVKGSMMEGDPFERGTWAIPVLVTNLAVLAFGTLYYIKKLPNFFRNSIKFILEFEVSRNVAIIVLVAIVFGYIGLGIEDLSIDEGKTYGDRLRVDRVVEKWPLNEDNAVGLMNRHVTNFLLKSSDVLFQNLRIIPFIASISFLILTYFFTLEITKKRFAGLVATVILFQSYNFQVFDTLAAYPNFWGLFYLLSLYLIFKKWQLSSITYIVSIFAKPLTAIFFPMTLFFTYRAEMPRRKKIYITISYAIIVVIMILVVFGANVHLGGGSATGKIQFDYKEFWSGFTTWSYQLRFESLFLLFILPLTVGLFLTSRKGVPMADSMLVLIVGVILSMPLLAAMTGFNLHPYRYIPLIDFFAIGVATLLSKKSQTTGLKTV